MVTLTIWTYCDAPIAPFVSGGTNAKPKTRRLSAADWPSKPITVETPLSGPASGAETASARPLANNPRVARGSAISRSGCFEGAPPPANRASGSEVSWRAFFRKSGPAANAEVADNVNSDNASDRERRVMPRIGGTSRCFGDDASRRSILLDPPVGQAAVRRCDGFYLT